MNQAAAKQHAPETGMWIFILADMCIFALYFWVFLHDKSLHPDEFLQGQATLNTTLGGANTLILLVSSFFMASAVHANRNSDIPSFIRHLLFTILCGCAFLAIKGIEYSEKFAAGYHVASNVFYRDYFAFTALHMFHVITGILLLAYALYFSTRTENIHTHSRYIENTGLYWHMVDLLWIVLFSLIYLIP